MDHGKSTLVRALTGTDPDRLGEEKQRGLTIDLGFAGMVLPSGAQVAFVDVPGHVRFLKNMMAGVSGVDVCLFVVAATEGWKPQSEEHLRILELFGVRRGVIALTKVGAADADSVELAQLEIAERVAGTFLEPAPVVAVDGVSGDGVDGLIAALSDLFGGDLIDGVGVEGSGSQLNRPRLWVDRSFPIKGSGTVVTGTLTGGTISEGDTLEVLPAGVTVRVRGLQSLNETQSSVGPGSRVALNLSGISHGDVARGCVVVRAQQWHLSEMVDAELSALESLDHDVTRKGAYLAYIGSGEHPVKLRVLGSKSISPGGVGLVRMYLPQMLPLVRGDRFILRESGRAETVGGGEVLDVAPVLPANRARPDRSSERIIAEHGRIKADFLERLTGAVDVGGVRVGEWIVSDGYLETVSGELSAAVAEAGAAGLDLAELDEFQRTVVAELDDVLVDAGRARLAGAKDELSEHPFLIAAAASPFAPPAPEGVDGTELRLLVQRKLLVESDGIYFAASGVEQAAQLVAQLLEDKPEGFTVAEARDVWNTSRKYALALLGHMDRVGMTRRNGDYRTAGPRL